MDYGDLSQVEVHQSMEDLFSKYSGRKCYYASTKVYSANYSQVSYQAGDMIVFGPETRGLPRELLEANRDRAIRIPMLADKRSLNLSNSVAIVAYEALRQLDFPGMI